MARRRLSIILIATFALCACVGDSNQPNDGGGDVTVNDASPDVKTDAGPTTCVFGTSHFGDGCKFQP
jgi:hypothetical protein